MLILLRFIHCFIALQEGFNPNPYPTPNPDFNPTLSLDPVLLGTSPARPLQPGPEQKFQPLSVQCSLL